MAFQRFDGSNFVNAANVRRWDGSQWLNAGFARRWDGSAWVDALLSFLIVDRSISGSATSPATAFATVTFLDNGALAYSSSDLGSGSFAGEWMNPLGGDSPGNYSVRATQFSSSGAATRTGTTGAWLQLNAERSWSISTTGLGAKTWGLTFEVRRDADSTVVATGAITLEVEAV